MNENWEHDDWEDDEFVVPALNTSSQEQLKKLEERRLQEESDYLVAKDLFSNEEATIEKFDAEKNIEKVKIIEKKVFIKRKNISNNEAKQKEASRKIREEKAKKEKEIDTYGENDYCDKYDEYLEFEDKF
jgi:hypothetical protein